MPTLAKAHILRGEKELRGELTGFGWSVDVDLQDATSFLQGARIWQPGIVTAELSFEGFFSATPFDQFVGGDLGASAAVPLSLAPDGFDVVGKRAYLLSAREQEYSVGSRVGELVDASASYRGDGRVGVGIVVTALNTRSANSIAPTQDNGAATSNGAIANLHVTAASGTSPTLVVAVQHSADATTWADLIAFTPVSAPGAETKAVTGTVNRYVRAYWTIGGTSPSFTFAVAFAR